MQAAPVLGAVGSGVNRLRYGPLPAFAVVRTETPEAAGCSSVGRFVVNVFVLKGFC